VPLESVAVNFTTIFIKIVVLHILSTRKSNQF
jgi:hypothetical protein